MANRASAGPQSGPQASAAGAPESPSVAPMAGPHGVQNAGRPDSASAEVGLRPARRALLTDLAIRKLKPEASRFELWDTSLAGFGVRVAPTGRKTWIVRYRVSDGTRRRERIGQAWVGAEPTTSLKDAREQARNRLGAVASGIDPVARAEAEAAAAALPRYTVADLGRDFLADGTSLKSHRRPWRPKTRIEFERIVNAVIVPKLGALAPDQVTKRDVRLLLADVASRSALTMSNRVLDVVRLMWRWGVLNDRVESTPAWPLPLGEKRKRDRVLTEDELRALWSALDHEPQRAPTTAEEEQAARGRVGFVLSCAFKLMLLTGQRRGEVLRFRWRDVTEERRGRAVRLWWTLPADFTKGNRKHRVPLSPQAVAVLDALRPATGDGEWAFPSPHAVGVADAFRDAATAERLAHRRARHAEQRERAYAGGGFIANPQKAADRLWARCGIEDAHVHDLRRTAATMLSSMKVSRVVVGKLLNHAEHTVTGGVYDLYEYDNEKLLALDAWGRRLDAVVKHGGATARNVVNMVPK